MLNLINLSKGDFISPEDIDAGLKDGTILDITKGGLLNGYPHEKGGIRVIIFNENIKQYYIAEYEGKEFVINYNSYKKYSDKLENINHITNKNEFHIERAKIINKRISDISTNSEIIINPNDKLCFAPYTFVVNIVATSNHIDTLIQINNQNLLKNK